MIKNILVCLAIFGAFIGGYYFPREEKQSQCLGSVSDATLQAMRVDWVIANERMKGDLGVNLAYGTSGEWSNAYITAATDLNVSLPPIPNQAVLSPLIRVKLGLQSKMCNNPNSVASEKDKEILVTPR